MGVLPRLAVAAALASLVVVAEQDGLYSDTSPVTTLNSSDVPEAGSKDQPFMLVVRCCLTHHLFRHKK